MNPDFKRKHTDAGGKPRVPQPQPAEGLMLKKRAEAIRRSRPSSVWENIKPEIQKAIDNELVDRTTGGVIKQKGEFPTAPQLQRAGLSWLVGQIFAHHGGLNAVRKKLGFSVNQVSPRQYSSWDSIRPEVQKVIDGELKDNDTGDVIKKKGEFPTQSSLKRAGLSWLERQIQRNHGGFIAMRRKLGFALQKAETGHWSQWSVLESALLAEINKEYCDDDGKVVKKAGVFPTQRQLARFGEQGLTSAASTYHGGLWKVRMKMGYANVIIRGRVRSKANGYWREWANVERELRAEMAVERRDKDGKLLKAAGEFPSNRLLKAIGKQSLANSISVYHGGFLEVRKRLGFAINPESVPGYWDDWSVLESRLKGEIAKEYKDENGKIVKAAGEFPTQAQLALFGQHSLLTGIKQNGGLMGVRKKLGFVIPRSLNGHWHDWDTLQAELKREIEREYVDKEGNVFKKEGEFPTALKLHKAGRGDLIHAIVDHHGGFTAVRMKLGIRLNKEENGHWRDWGEAKGILEAIIVEPIHKDGRLVKKRWEFPTATALESAGFFSLSNSIKQEFGGFSHVRERFGFDPLMKPDGYWDEWKNLELELKAEIEKEYIDKNGKVTKRKGEFPTQKQLEATGCSSLNFGINKHGGFSVVKQRMGFKSRAHPAGYYTVWENIEPEINKVVDSELKDKDTGETIKKRGEFPTQRQLAKSGFSWLLNHVQKYHGGMLAVRARIGYVGPTNESVNQILLDAMQQFVKETRT